MTHGERQYICPVEGPFIRPIYAAREQFLREAIRQSRQPVDSEPLRLLDAGCGDGYWLHRLSDMEGIEFHGLDYNPLRAKRAMEVAPHAQISLGNLCDFEPQRQFDIVLLNQVIEHVTDDLGLLRHLKKFLKPHGRLIVGTPNEGALLQQIWLRCRGALKETDHVHFYTERKIRSTIEHAGFRVTRIMREVFFPGSYRLFYGLTKRKWGFHLLQLGTKLLPGQCSDYYFVCMHAGTIGNGGTQ